MAHKKTVDANTLLSRADENHCFELYQDLELSYNYSPHPVRMRTEKTGKAGEVIEHKDEGGSFIDYSIPPLDSAAVGGIWRAFIGEQNDIKNHDDRGDEKGDHDNTKNTVSIDKKCRFCPVRWTIKKCPKKKKSKRKKAKKSVTKLLTGGVRI